MGLRDRLSGGKNKDEGAATASAPEPKKSRGRGRVCFYGHDVPRGKKMCEHRHWVG